MYFVLRLCVYEDTFDGILKWRTLSDVVWCNKILPFLVTIMITTRHIIAINLSIKFASSPEGYVKENRISLHYLFLFNRKDSNVGASPTATPTVLAM